MEQPHKNDNTAFFVLLVIIAIATSFMAIDVYSHRKTHSFTPVKTDTVNVANGVDTLYIKP